MMVMVLMVTIISIWISIMILRMEQRQDRVLSTRHPSMEITDPIMMHSSHYGPHLRHLVKVKVKVRVISVHHP